MKFHSSFCRDENSQSVRADLVFHVANLLRERAYRSFPYSPGSLFKRVVPSGMEPAGNFSDSHVEQHHESSPR